MRWDGIRRDTAAVDAPGFDDLVNVSHHVAGEIRRRPGLSDRAATSSILLQAFRDTRDNDEDWIVKQTPTGDIVGGKIGGTDANVLQSIPAATTPGSFTNFNGVLYFFHPAADGVAIESGNDSAQTSAIGLAAPVGGLGDPSTAAGSVTPGTHLLRYRYYNSELGYYSNPSEPVTVVVSDDQSDAQLTFTVAAFGGSADIVGSDNARCDKIIVEMTLANGRQFYDAAFIDNGSVANVVISLEDATLEQRLRRAFGQDLGAEPPPRLLHATIHRGRMFGLDASNPYTMHWSSAGQPEGWDTTAQSRRIFGNTGDVPVALFSVFEDLYIFGQRSMAKLRYNVEPAIGQLDVIDESGSGLWNARCLVVADGITYGFGRNGIWTIPAGVPRRMSEPVDDILQSINAAESDKFHGVFDADERVISWWYVESGETTAKACLRYDIDLRVWSRATYQDAITASTIAIGSNGDLVATVSDSNYCWSLDYDVFDGVPSGTPAVAVTTAGSTDTVINVSTVISDDLAGAYARNVSTDEVRLIASSTTSTITLASPFSAAPDAAINIYLGAFDTIIQPKWSSQNGMRNKTRPTKYEISMVPSTGSAVGSFRTYGDFTSTATEYLATDSDLFADGITVNNGQSIVEFDLTGGVNNDGYICMPLPSDWHRVVRARIEFVKPEGLVRLLDIGYVSDSGDAAAVMDE